MNKIAIAIRIANITLYRANGVITVQDDFGNLVYVDLQGYVYHLIGA